MEHHSEISEHYEQTKDSRNFQREKLLTYKIQKVRKIMVSDLATALLDFRIPWNNIFKVSRKIYLKIRLLYLAKLSNKLRVK